MQIQKHNS